MGGKEQISSRENTPCGGLEERRSLEHKRYWDEVGVTGASVPDEAGTLRRWGGGQSQQSIKDFGLGCIQKPLKQFLGFGRWREESREIYNLGF